MLSTYSKTVDTWVLRFLFLDIFNFLNKVLKTFFVLFKFCLINRNILVFVIYSSLQSFHSQEESLDLDTESFHILFVLIWFILNHSKLGFRYHSGDTLTTPSHIFLRQVEVFFFKIVESSFKLLIFPLNSRRIIHFWDWGSLSGSLHSYLLLLTQRRAVFSL